MLLKNLKKSNNELNIKKFEKYIQHKARSGYYSVRYKFPNNYGANVVNVHNVKNGYFVAIYHNGHLCFETHISDDIITNLDECRVKDILEQIYNLPKSDEL